MLFRDNVGKLVNIDRNHYTTDREYYTKLREVYKKDTTEVVVEIRDAPIFKYILNLL